MRRLTRVLTRLPFKVRPILIYRSYHDDNKSVLSTIGDTKISIMDAAMIGAVAKSFKDMKDYEKQAEQSRKIRSKDLICSVNDLQVEAVSVLLRANTIEASELDLASVLISNKIRALEARLKTARWWQTKSLESQRSDATCIKELIDKRLPTGKTT